MISWQDLTLEEQRRWLLYAEIELGRQVSWDDVEQAPREYWLMIVRIELQRNRWEDKSMEERRAALAQIDQHDQELSQKKEEALQFICRDLGVRYTPGDTDAPFWELAWRAYGPTDGPGNPKIPLKRRLRFAVAYISAMKKSHFIPDVRKREKRALEMLRNTARWGYRQPKSKGRPQQRTLRSMQQLLAQARAHPPIRDMLEGKITPWECRGLLAVYEIMLPRER